MPCRIQRQRRQGWRLPANAICVTRPSRWGNPYHVTPEHAPAEVLQRFTVYAEARLAQEPDWLDPLRGKDLACWCPEAAPPCHADVLLRLANGQ
jgi:hypothetical protein